MKSLVYIFTGSGKGKTSAALGMALRAICNDEHVAWIAWYKEASWGVSEYRAAEFLGEKFSMYIEGKGFYFADATKIKPVRVGAVVDKHTEDDHRDAAQSALSQARKILLAQKTDVLICDELCQAVAQELVSLSNALELIKLRGKTHMILTGRDCPQELIAVADTVTEMTKVKHAYDQGIMALKGLDF